MIEYAGLGCTATLDVERGTVTLVHSGIAAAKHKKASSPWVIPLGAIEDVEFVPTTLLKRGHMRFLIRGRAGYSAIEGQDVNAFLLKGKGADTFVDGVRRAAAAAAPVEGFGAPGSDTAHAPSRLERMHAANDHLREVVAANDRERELAKTHNFPPFAVREDGVWHEGTQYDLVGVRAQVYEIEPGSLGLSVHFPNGAYLAHRLKPKQVGGAERFAALVNELAVAREASDAAAENSGS